MLRRRQNRAAAFTLMELLVVITIIAIVVGATIAMVSGLMRGGRVKQAQNMVTSYLSAGRATALAMHTPVAVVFFMDRHPATGSPRAAVQLVREVPHAGRLAEMHFSAIGDRPVEYLPEGIDVVTLSDLQGTLAGGNFPCRAVLFSAEGQLLVRNGLVGDNADWKMNGRQPTPEDGDETIEAGTSAGGVLVYNARELANKGLTGGAAEDWMLKNGDVQLVNVYTGNVLR